MRGLHPSGIRRAATWWIPPLVSLGFWRHVTRRIPLAYDVVYWSAVFPLGMYSVCTHRMVEVLELPFLSIVPQIFVIIAIGAWVVTLLGLLIRMSPLWQAGNRQ